ncbi:MAG: alpha-galactosidase [Anaerolineales bacterium]|nr:alpha-galactosidase [Anaerolineales bacterium]
MKYTIENPYMQLEVNTSMARWSILNRQRGIPCIEDIHIYSQYHNGRKQFQSLDHWSSSSISDPVTTTSSQGPVKQIQILIGPDRGQLQYTLTFALPIEYPLLLWKISAHNRGEQSVFIDKLEMFSAGFIYKKRTGPTGKIYLSTNSNGARKSHTWHSRKNRQTIPTGEYAFFSNGWQSWSYAGVYNTKDRYRSTRLGPLRLPLNVNSSSPRPCRAGAFASDMFGILGDRKSRIAVLVGFLSQLDNFGSLEALTTPTPALRLWASGDNARLDPGALMTTDWACLQFLHLDDHDPLGIYMEAVAREHNLIKNLGDQSVPSDNVHPIPTGWCSWYQFSTEDYISELTAEDIHNNLTSITELDSRLPLQQVQIDSGFEAQVGDWFHFNDGFQQGVAPIAAKIQESGHTPGLWLAPFIVDPRSQISANHPDWLIKGSFNRPANAGFLFGRFATGLDLTHPDALTYVDEVIHTAVHEWGFPYLKLDFLYAATLQGRYRDPTLTRAQILRLGLEHIRKSAGKDVFILGCGCPLGPAIGLVDAMRIGADVDRRWNASYKGIEFLLKNESDMPSTRWSTHSAITRAPMHRRWWINDPDCLLVRPTTNLTLAEVQTLATTIALTGGSMLLSDHLPDLPSDRLHIAEVLLPVIDKRPYILDWFDNPTPQRLQLDLEDACGHWSLLALFNWSDSMQDIHLDIKDFYIDSQPEYLAREFWSGKTYHIVDGTLEFTEIYPHSVVLLSIRPYRPYQPQYLGSDMHISQGLKVSSWKTTQNDLEVSIKRPGLADGILELGLPHPPQFARIETQEVFWRQKEDHIYQFQVEFYKEVTLHISY